MRTGKTTAVDAIAQAEAALDQLTEKLLVRKRRDWSEVVECKRAVRAAARKLALEYGAALLEAADCDERPERFFDPCIHREGREAGTRGVRICQLALRERLLAPSEEAKP